MQICSVEGCGRRHKARGFCATHYAQQFRGAQITAKIKTRDTTPFECCSVEDCKEPVKARGLCATHYQRHLRHGHTRYTDRKRPPRDCTFPGCDNHVYAKDLCHSHYLKKRSWAEFGFTLYDYFAMAKQQDFKCAICGQPEKTKDGKSGKTKDLAVDHCHTTNRIRGLLCSNCNTGIGLFCDDPSLIRKAVDYLKTPPS